MRLIRSSIVEKVKAIAAQKEKESEPKVLSLLRPPFLDNDELIFRSVKQFHPTILFVAPVKPGPRSVLSFTE